MFPVGKTVKYILAFLLISSKAEMEAQRKKAEEEEMKRRELERAKQVWIKFFPSKDFPLNKLNSLLLDRVKY